MEIEIINLSDDESNNATFARGTPLLRIDKIREHMRTSEHKKFEELLKPNTTRQLSTKLFL
ncbi:3527_t:CDS:2 [Entrophospora sp. SA101]|nr:3527_t:CDS:2 [Entrophospora sp. SA101]